MIIAEDKFVINSSREKTEQLVMKAMISALQPERMHASDERSFRAMVRVNIGSIHLPVHMEGEITSPSNPLEFMIKLKGLDGIIWLNQKAIFTLKSIDGDTTEVASQLMAEAMSTVTRIFLLWKVKRFAAEILEDFEKYLRRWS